MAESSNTKRTRDRSSPTGVTPKAKQKRRHFSSTLCTKSKRQLHFSGTGDWSIREKTVLLDYVGSIGDGFNWVYSKKPSTWENASAYIKEHCGTSRTSGACRSLATARFPSMFSDIEDAKKKLGIPCFPHPSTASHSVLTGLLTCTPPSVTSRSNRSDTDASFSPVVIATEDSMQTFQSEFLALTVHEQTELLEQMYQRVAESEQIDVPSDFISLSLKGMKQLKCSGRSNFIYGLCKGLGQQRKDGTDSVFPSKRVISGLFQHSVNFFNASNAPCPGDYRMWIETMYTLFGNKWLNLHSGPMWKVDETQQDTDDVCGAFSKLKVSTEARVNIPALSASTIRRDISKSNFDISSDIQVATIEQANHHLPGSRWWIKSDGCDVVRGLMESVRNVWNGDVDLGDGTVQNQHSEYIQRLELVKNISVCDHTTMSSSLQNMYQQLSEDSTFIDSALRKAQSAFEAKCSVSTTDKALYSLGWNVDELSKLGEMCRSLMLETSVLRERVVDQTNPIVGLHYAVEKLQSSVREFLRRLNRHQRTPATHVLVTMISPSERNRKPYALPICCLPYAGLSEAKARSHISSVAEEMCKRGMHIEGFVSNGEYNVFRHKGYTRPLSVFQIQSQCRKKYSAMSEKKMKEMLTSVESQDGCIRAIQDHPAITSKLIDEIHKWKKHGASFEDVIDRLRSRCVPSEHVPKAWMLGRKEELGDKLRSVLAQLEYTHIVCEWDEKGVPFKTHFYVPEIHPVTNREFHEREDDAHILKRIATSTRCGGPGELKLERFSEALEDPLSGLTYAALTGQNKQSVRDAERLFSSSLRDFMKKKGYTFEEEYIRVILNWRRASDERGLSEGERSCYNIALLNYIKNDLIPWHHQSDLSTLEVNRLPIKVCGFTREVLIALTTTIESKEWIMKRNALENMSPEHPRSSSTDDVECFFSLLRTMIGNHFTTIDVRFVWRKLCNEFAKRLNRDLPFYYHTSKNERFAEVDRPSFEVYQCSKRNPRHQRIRTREQPGQLAPGRATLVKPGVQSIRRQFHNLPVELPPPPATQRMVSHDHSYA